MPLTRVNVFFTPPPPGHLRGRTTLVIDTLRATTTLVTLVANDAAVVYPTPSDAEAFALAKTLPGSHLCGEREGRRVPGFEFGDSPLELLDAGIAGKTFVQSTSNGTRALTISAGTADGNNSAGTADANTSAGTAAEDPSANPSADHTLVACLRNRAAAVQAAIETLANAGNPDAGANDAGAALSGIAIICAGERLATSPSVEDSFTAGACVYPLLDALPPDQLFLESGARLALRIFDAYGRDPARAFADSPHADFLSSIGYTGDLDFAAELDADSTVPRATRDAEGRIVVRR